VSGGRRGSVARQGSPASAPQLARPGWAASSAGEEPDDGEHCGCRGTAVLDSGPRGVGRAARYWPVIGMSGRHRGASSRLQARSDAVGLSRRIMRRHRRSACGLGPGFTRFCRSACSGFIHRGQAGGSSCGWRPARLAVRLACPCCASSVPPQGRRSPEFVQSQRAARRCCSPDSPAARRPRHRRGGRASSFHGFIEAFQLLCKISNPNLQ
jgi:hypothetical protein